MIVRRDEEPSRKIVLKLDNLQGYQNPALREEYFEVLKRTVAERFPGFQVDVVVVNRRPSYDLDKTYELKDDVEILGLEDAVEIYDMKVAAYGIHRRLWDDEGWWKRFQPQ